MASLLSALPIAGFPAQQFGNGGLEFEIRNSRASG